MHCLAVPGDGYNQFHFLRPIAGLYPSTLARPLGGFQTLTVAQISFQRLSHPWVIIFFVVEHSQKIFYLMILLKHQKVITSVI